MWERFCSITKLALAELLTRYLLEALDGPTFSIVSEETAVCIFRNAYVQLQSVTSQLTLKGEAIRAGSWQLQEKRLADDEISPADVRYQMVILDVDVKRRQVLLRQRLVVDRRVTKIGECSALLTDDNLRAKMRWLRVHPLVGGKAPQIQCPIRHGLIDGSDDPVVDRLHIEPEADNVVLAGLQEILFKNWIGIRHVQIGKRRKFHAGAIHRIPHHHNAGGLDPGPGNIVVVTAIGGAAVPDHGHKIVFAARG